MIDIEKMKQAALAATPGEWKAYDCAVFFPNAAGGFDISFCPNPEANSTFIAEANPSAVLELITRLEAATTRNVLNARVDNKAITDLTLYVSVLEEKLKAAEQDAAENQRLSHDAIRALARIDEALGIGEGENDSEGFADLDTTLEEIYLLKEEARRGKALAIAVITDHDENVTDDAAQTLETLGNKIAAQAAVIEKLRWALKFYANPASDTFGNTARKALDNSTDSTQILQEWLDEKLGEPIATKLETQQFNCFHVSSNDSKRLKELPVGAQLFKKPESFGVCV